MEEFVTVMKSNIVAQSSPPEKKSSRFRELFRCIVVSSPEVKIIDGCDSEGDIRFEVSMKSMGISYETLMKYKEEISSDFTANFMGELLIRENMDKFIKSLTDLENGYLSAVNKYEHRKFGLKVFRDKFVFTFHASLLQNILTEDFKKKVR